MDKWICTECDEVCTDTQVLRAPNPFDDDHIICGCPCCREVNSLLACCDEPGCEQLVTCGTPTEDGYRKTCTKHAPWRRDATTSNRSDVG